MDIYGIIDNINEKISRIQIKDNTSEKIANLYSTLIQAKLEVDKNDKDLYQDIKNFIKAYLQYKEEQRYGYDVVNESKILNLIDLAFENDIKKKIALLRYAELQIRRLNMPENDGITQAIEKAKFQVLKDEKNWKSYLKRFLNFTSSSITRILITSVAIFFLLSILLLPAYSESFIILDFKAGNYTDFFIPNHLISLLAYIVSLDEEIKIVPTNVLGVLLLSFLKILYLLFVINYLFQHLQGRIKKFLE